MLTSLTACGSPIEMPAPPAPQAPPPVSGGPPPSTTDIVAPPVLVGVPTNVTATAEDRAVTIGWNLVSGAYSFRIDWETDLTDLEDAPGAGSVTHGEIAPLANGILHTYTVGADGSAVVVSAIPSAASGAPTDVSVTPGPDGNALSWQSVAGATAYRVYWSFAAGVTPFNGTRIEVGAATAYVHAGLEPGADYHYVVTAVSSNGVESAASAGVGGRPGQTAAVSVTAGDRRVTLSWTDAVAPSITYTKSLALYVGSPFFFPYRITGLENGTRYGFRVTPRYTQGNGRPSTRVYATPAASVADVPQGVTITAGRDENTITWSPVVGATSYVVTWDGTSAGSDTVTGTAFRHAGLKPSSLLACLAADSACPAYSYTVTVSGGSTSSATVGAVSIPFQPFPPLITNTTRVILAGLKPAGTSIALNGVEIVPRSRDTGWEYPVELSEGPGPNLLSFVAIDDAGHVSAAASYQITLDTYPPAPPGNITASCATSTVGPPRATFTGTKTDKESTAIVMLEPGNFERVVVGADDTTTWTATVDASVGNVVFTFIAKDIAGNASPSVTDTVTCL